MYYILVQRNGWHSPIDRMEAIEALRDVEGLSEPVESVLGGLEEDAEKLGRDGNAEFRLNRNTTLQVRVRNPLEGLSSATPQPEPRQEATRVTGNPCPDNTIVVVSRGGVIQGVYTPKGDAPVFIVDWDDDDPDYPWETKSGTFEEMGSDVRDVIRNAGFDPGIPD